MKREGEDLCAEAEARLGREWVPGTGPCPGSRGDSGRRLVWNHESPQSPAPRNRSSPHSSLSKGIGSLCSGCGMSDLTTSVDR